jgi:hypothetical protein
MIEFIHSYDEDGIDLIVEGVAVLPEFAAKLDVPCKSVFLGNTSGDHAAVIKKQARENDHDWMHAHSEKGIEKAAEFFALFSSRVQVESKRYGLRYVEIADSNFEESLGSAADYLLSD